ncbi:hypothetical protein EJK15_31925 [Nonomuraea basaltis]|nr:hypothetical protein EJK15_31925 [Nonomuraea basaltis]
MDAFCVMSLPDGHPAPAEVLARKLPVVIVDEPYVPGHPFVGIDEPAAGAAAARHVLELGHRRIAVAMVGLHEDGYTGWADLDRQKSAGFEAMRGRRGGYQSACEEAGLHWAGVPFYEVARFADRPAALTRAGDRPERNDRRRHLRPLDERVARISPAYQASSTAPQIGWCSPLLKDDLMAEFIEVRTTIDGHEKAAALAHGLLRAGLATSIDIDEVPSDESTWQLTLITAERQAHTVEQRIRETGENGPIISRPVTHDIDCYPDWLTDQP